MLISRAVRIASGYGLGQKLVLSCMVARWGVRAFKSLFAHHWSRPRRHLVALIDRERELVHRGLLYLGRRLDDSMILLVVRERLKLHSLMHLANFFIIILHG